VHAAFTELVPASAALEAESNGILHSHQGVQNVLYCYSSFKILFGMQLLWDEQSAKQQTRPEKECKPVRLVTKN